MRQNFSPYKHSLLFIAHKRVVVYLYFEVKTTPSSGVISKKKKKRSSPVSLHLFHHFWPKYATKRDVKQVMTFFFFFFWRCYCSDKFFGQNIRTLTQIAKKSKIARNFTSRGPVPPRTPHFLRLWQKYCSYRLMQPRYD